MLLIVSGCFESYKNLKANNVFQSIKTDILETLTGVLVVFFPPRGSIKLIHLRNMQFLYLP